MTSTRTDEIIDKVNEIIDQYDTALTLRQIYYRLVAALVIPNNVNQYKALSKLLVEARKDERVDYRKIEDRVRKTIGGDYTFFEPDDYFRMWERRFRESPKYFNIPRWYNQPWYVEVWIEKDALSRIISDVADGLGVKTCVARGYSSFTFIKDAVERINHACDVPDGDIDHREPKILYFGDFDPSGEDMVRDLEERLFDYGITGCDFDSGEILTSDSQTPLVEKLALTPEQIVKWRLPPMPTKASDVRSAKFIEKHGDIAVELDALDPEVLKNLVGGGIAQYFNLDVTQEVEVLEKEQKAELQKKVDAFFSER